MRAVEAGEGGHGLGEGGCRQSYHPVVATVGDEDGVVARATDTDGDIDGAIKAGVVVAGSSRWLLRALRRVTGGELRWQRRRFSAADGHLRGIAQPELSEEGQYFQLPPSLVNNQVSGFWSFGDLDIVVVTTAVARSPVTWISVTEVATVPY